MSNKKPFKPVFDGYFKIFLHDDGYKKAADRAQFTGAWIASKRKRIMKKDRKFQARIAKHGFQGQGWTG